MMALDSPWHFPQGHAAARAAYLRAVEAVFLTALAEGPCSVSEARQAVSLWPPAGVDARCAGRVSVRLAREGRIVFVRWGRSPLASHHHGVAGVWRLAEVAP